MPSLITIIVATAAVTFIAVSGAMNALFLSSLGQTPTEAKLLASVSVSADLAKAVLPVLVVRAILLRAWMHVAIASIMLMLLVILSLSSGAGFAALTRNAVTTSKLAVAEQVTALREQLAEFDRSVASVAAARQLAVIEAELEGLKVDWSWTATKGCSEINGATTRRFCTLVAALRSDLATAQAYNRLTAERRGTRERLDRLLEGGASKDHDPQATTIAALFRIDPSLPRVVLPVSIAVVLELGSVILVLLWAGPTVSGWKAPVTDERLTEPPTPPVLVHPPPSHPPDPVGWQLQQSRSRLTVAGDGGHAR